jgi:hypothetical protein
MQPEDRQVMRKCLDHDSHLRCFPFSISVRAGFRTKNRLQVLHAQTGASAVNQSLKDLLNLCTHCSALRPRNSAGPAFSSSVLSNAAVRLSNTSLASGRIGQGARNPSWGQANEHPLGNQENDTHRCRLFPQLGDSDIDAPYCLLESPFSQGTQQGVHKMLTSN